MREKAKTGRQYNLFLFTSHFLKFDVLNTIKIREFLRLIACQSDYIQESFKIWFVLINEVWNDYLLIITNACFIQRQNGNIS